MAKLSELRQVKHNIEGIGEVTVYHFKTPIQRLKKELNLTNSKIAAMFGMSLDSYANSSAKKRYENALCEFYEVVKENNS